MVTIIIVIYKTDPNKLKYILDKIKVITNYISCELRGLVSTISIKKNYQIIQKIKVMELRLT